MKVLKPGRPVAQWTQKVICTGVGSDGGGCRAELEVEIDDVYLITKRHGDDYNPHYVVRCPQCGVETAVYGVPEVARNSIPDRSHWLKEHPQPPTPRPLPQRQ